jgi:acyl carrier protein
MYGATSSDLHDDASLLETGVLDSTSVLELVSHLEETYGITVESTELVPQNLDSIDRLEAFLRKKGVAVAA